MGRSLPLPRFLYKFLSSRSSCGNCGKLGASAESFPSPVETVGKSSFDFSTVSTGRQFPQLGKWGRRRSWLVFQINLSDRVRTEIHVPKTVLGSGPQGHRITPEGLADSDHPVLKGNAARAVDLPDLVGRAVFNGGQHLRKRPRADLVAAAGHGQAQGLMRALVIVKIAPLLQTVAHLFEVTIELALQHFGLQAAMKPFGFPLSLGMVGPAMTDPNAQTQQPDAQHTIGGLRVIAPGRTVVHQQAFGQAIATKGGGQMLLHGFGLLIATGCQAQRIAGMIIQHTQRMAALAAAQGKMALKIHLPQLIRNRVLKALPSPVLGRLDRIDPSLPLQDGVNGAGSWNRRLSGGLQTGPNLAG